MLGRGRPVLVGVLLGVVLVVAVFGYVAYAYTSRTDQVETDKVLVVALAEDADGAQVAGIVGVLDWTPGAERIRVIDPLTEIAGTGTSYTALKDQYPFGGGESVSRAVASIEGGEPLPWIVLPADVWIGLVDAAGGLSYDVERPTNAYVRGELFLIEAGEQTLSGGETYAIAAAAFSLAETATATPGAIPLSSAVLRTLDASWNEVVDVVQTGDAESSMSPTALQEMGD